MKDEGLLPEGNIRCARWGGHSWHSSLSSRSSVTGGNEELWPWNVLLLCLSLSLPALLFFLLWISTLGFVFSQQCPVLSRHFLLIHGCIKTKMQQIWSILPCCGTAAALQKSLFSPCASPCVPSSAVSSSWTIPQNQGCVTHTLFSRGATCTFPWPHQHKGSFVLLAGVLGKILILL